MQYNSWPLAYMPRRPDITILVVVAHIILLRDTHRATDATQIAAHEYLHGDYMEDDCTNMEILRSYTFSAADWQNARDYMASPTYTLPRL